MKALVTGGAGFIGSHIVDALLAEGHDVRVLDNFSTGHRANIGGGEVEVIEGDLRSLECVSGAVRGAEVVFHQGALPSVPRSIQDPLTSNAVNVEGTLNLVLASRDHGVRRLIFASSSSLYGDAPDMPRREEQPLRPLAPYAVAKLAAERYALVANTVFGLETVALRYFNVYGERQDPTSRYAAVIPKFIRLMLAGERPPIFGDGSVVRDFTHVENVVNANLSAVAAPEAPGTAINVALGEAHSINRLVVTLNGLLKTDLEPEYLDPRPGDLRKSVADLTLARDTLGYEPSVGFEDGLRRTIDWIAEHAPAMVAADPA